MVPSHTVPDQSPVMRGVSENICRGNIFEWQMSSCRRKKTETAKRTVACEFQCDHVDMSESQPDKQHCGLLEVVHSWRHGVLVHLHHIELLSQLEEPEGIEHRVKGFSVSWWITDAGDFALVFRPSLLFTRVLSDAISTKHPTGNRQRTCWINDLCLC